MGKRSEEQIMDNIIRCKSCSNEMSKLETHCPVCHVKSPQQMSDKKRKTLYLSIAAFIVLIVVIPMVASLLWMQSN